MTLIAVASGSFLTAAQAQIHEVSINSTLTRDGVRATLQKLVVTGTNDRANVTAVFRITDAAGHPLTVVRNARIALIEAHAASQPTYSERHPAIQDRPDSANVYATIIALRAQVLRRVRTLSLDLQAARVTPTKVWTNVPVRAEKTDPPGVEAYSDRTVAAQVTGVYRGTISSPIGRQATPVVTVEVTEKLRGKRPPAQLPGGAPRGLVEVEAKGTRDTGEVYASHDAVATYEVGRMLAGRGRLPDRVTIRYYSAPAVAQAIKSYHFAFRGLHL